MLGLAIAYFMGALCMLLLLSEDRTGRGAFIVSTPLALLAALLWPLSFVLGILAGLWILVGGAYQWFFNKEGK